MSRSAFIPGLPCEELVRKVMGEGWRNLPSDDIDGAWGVAIIRSILDGVSVSIREISAHLGVDRENMRDAFTRLSFNGVFLRSRIRNDRKALNNNKILAWSYYAGIASGATGHVTHKPRRAYEKRKPRS